LLDGYNQVNEIFNFKNFDNSQNFDSFLEEIKKQNIEVISNPKIIYKKLED